MNDSINRLEELEHKTSSMGLTLDRATHALRVITERMLVLESTGDTLSKIVNATLRELVEKDFLTQEAIMERIRRVEDDDRRQQVKEMLDTKLIEAVDVIKASSLVVVRKIRDDDSAVLFNYSTVEMPAPYVNDDIKKALLGKKIGDKIVTEGTGIRITSEVLEIYDLIESKRDGETEKEPKPAQHQSENP